MEDSSSILVPTYDPITGGIDVPLQSDVTIPAGGEALISLGVFFKMPPATAGFIVLKTEDKALSGKLVLHSNFFGELSNVL
jgi:hypothetical protein